MGHRTWIKAKIILKDNRAVLVVLGCWFLFGFMMFSWLYRLPLTEAVKACLFFEEAHGDFAYAYTIWTQGIIFGITFSLLFQNILQKYNPERSCRMFAKELRDHVVVVGHSHLGRRLVQHFREHEIPYCIIEKDRGNVDDLLREGEPVVVDDAKQEDALADSNVAGARVVILASNNLETALLVTKRVRDCNKECMIVARCFQDEFAEVLESLGANAIISSSKDAFDNILRQLDFK